MIKKKLGFYTKTNHPKDLITEIPGKVVKLP
jgi:hypothetical protein